MMTRHLDWEGCFNVRDLGGLATVDGRETAWGAVVRADDLSCLSGAGWAALEEHGVRTVLDLRNDDEAEASPSPRLPDIVTVRVPLDDIGDREFWGYCWANELDGSPLYYRPFLERKPERCARAVTAVARAAPGGVAIHCGGGRDRTGLVALLLEAMAGVRPEEIVRDYELSNLRLPARWAARGEEDQVPAIEGILGRKGTTARALILDLLEWLDPEIHISHAGLAREDLAAAGARLLRGTVPTGGRDHVRTGPSTRSV
jgi:protein-tyrosine phosphatase